MPKVKRRVRVGERVSCRQRKGHKWEERDCKDGENGKEDTARRKQTIRKMLKTADWEDYIEILRKKASEGRGRGPTAVARSVLFMKVQMIILSLQVEGI